MICRASTWHQSGAWDETHQDCAPLQVDALHYMGSQLHGLGVPAVETSQPVPDAIYLHGHFLL